MNELQSENSINKIENTTGSRQMVGFRCTQEVRNRLTREALENGKTLGGYIEDLVSAPPIKTEQYIPSNDNALVDVLLNRRIAALTNELNEVKRKYDLVIEKMEVFHQPKLLEQYNSSKGKMLSYINDAGRKVALRIEHPADVITILINLFKFEA